MERQAFVYIMASRRNGTLYIGSTTNLVQRIYQHREGLIDGFTKTYGCKLLVWFEAFETIIEARSFEQRMKNWNRAWKVRRIEERNRDWMDLYPTLA